MSDTAADREPHFVRRHFVGLAFTVLAGILPTVILYHLGYGGNAPEKTERPSASSPPQPEAARAGDRPGPKAPPVLENKKASSSDAAKFLD